MRNSNYSFTMVELIIAIILMGFLVLSYFSIDIFTRTHAIENERRVQLQNTASFVLEHMKKNLSGAAARSGAVGGVAVQPLSFIAISGDPALLAWVDVNLNGQLDALDKQVAYRYNTATYQIWYYDNYTDSPLAYVVLGKVKPGTGNSFIRPDFSRIDSGDFTQNTTQIRYDLSTPANFTNYFDVQIINCWDAAESTDTCGSLANPIIAMHGRIAMPSVSVH